MVIMWRWVDSLCSGEDRSSGPAGDSRWFNRSRDAEALPWPWLPWLILLAIAEWGRQPTGSLARGRCSIVLAFVCR
jgi:hypothetical protein